MATKKKQDPDQYILAFDPGGTTGMCLLRYNSKEVVLSVLAQIEDGHEGYYDNLVGVPAGYATPTTLVSEKWVEHGVKGADRTPLVIEGIQYAFWPDQMNYQTPDMKQLVDDDTLKEIGVWTEGKPHQMDALRHALIYLRNQEHEPTLELLGNDGQTMQQDGDGGGQGNGGGGKDGDGDEEQQHSLAVLMDPPDDEELEEMLATEAEKHYKKERDVDGAFSGYQPDVGEEVTMMIDEDF